MPDPIVSPVDGGDSEHEALVADSVAVMAFTVAGGRIVAKDALEARRGVVDREISKNGGFPLPRHVEAPRPGLAELPGIKVDTDATDSLGRHGYAIRSIESKSGGGIEFIFDPIPAEMLAQRSFLGDRERGPFDPSSPAA